MDPVADTAAIKPIGQAFSEERERQGLTRTEAAQRLHMSAYQVEALETGDYTRLPKGTFLRGFVRNYAKALGLDPNAMVSRLAEGVPTTPAPGIVVPSQNIRFDPLGERLANPYVKAGVVAVVAIALVLAGIYWWLFIKPTPPGGAPKKASEKPVAEAARPGAPQQIASANFSAPEPVAPTSAPVVAQAPKVEEKKVEAKKVEAKKVDAKKDEPKRLEARKDEPKGDEARKADAKKDEPNPVARVAGAKVLKLRFNGESWVEIRDGQGKVLMSRINSRGSEAEIEGRPPLTVIVGNAADVRVTYNDRDFPLAPHTKVSVARFTAE